MTSISERLLSYMQQDSPGDRLALPSGGKYVRTILNAEREVLGLTIPRYSGFIDAVGECESYVTVCDSVRVGGFQYFWANYPM